MFNINNQINLPPGPQEKLSINDIRKNYSLKYLLEFHQTYGDIVHYLIESWSVIFINHPIYIKQVLQDNHYKYSKEGTPDLMMLKPLLGEGLMTSEGKSWFQQRRLVQPAFHLERIHTFSKTITEITETLLGQWNSVVDQNKPLEITEEMSHLTLQIIAELLFGFNLSDEAEKLSNAVEVMNEYMARFDPHNLELILRFQAAKESFNTIVNKIIKEHRYQGKDTGDLLLMLMQARDENTGKGMSDRQLQDQILTLLMAGHETTAKALTWTFYLLEQYPNVAKKLQEELGKVLEGRTPTYEDLPQLSYTWMVIQESMRLYPPVWSMTRMCKIEDEIGGYRIPTGTLVLISPYAMHRHPNFWQEPEQFNPERFRPEIAEQRLPYTYFPFSGGPRQCVGSNLAKIESHLVLSTIAQKYQLKKVPNHPVEPESLVTLRPKFGLPMTVHSINFNELAY